MPERGRFPQSPVGLPYFSGASRLSLPVKLSYTDKAVRLQSSTCSIACRDPRSSRNCLILDQSFRDGTACGYGGRCRGGSCQSGSGLDRAKGWYRDHLNIAIPVTVVVGLLVLALLWCLLSCLCCRGRKGGFARNKPGRNQSYSNAYSNGGYYAPPPGPPPMRGGYGGQPVTRPAPAYSGY